MASGDSHPRRQAGVKDTLRPALTSKISKLETGSTGPAQLKLLKVFEFGGGGRAGKEKF